MPNIKIFVSNRIDIEAQQIEDDIYIPVRCGAVFTEDKTKKEMLDDDIGENISEKRMSFNELTVLYWAWKNQKADYYGLCHYRRYLTSQISDNDIISKDERNAGCISVNELNRSIVEKFGLDKYSISSMVDNYDAIFIKPLNLKEYHLKSNYEAMQKAPKYHKMKDMDLTLKIIEEKYPDMLKVAQKYMFNYEYSYLYNCFIMNAELFDKYCSWLFDILFALESKLDMSKYTISQYRTPGTIAERLLGIWILYLKETQKYRIKEVPLLFIENAKKKDILKPAFKENNIAIVSNFNNAYSSIFGVFLQSALSHISQDYNYDFIVLSSDLSEESRLKLNGIVKKYSNVSLRYTDPQWALLGIQKEIRDCVYSEDLYYRVVVPQILTEYEKVLVVDADMICCEDLKNLYCQNLDDVLAAGVKDIVFQGFLNGLVPNRLKYCEEYMKMSNPYNYINTGVLLFNCEAYRKMYDLDYLRKFIVKHMKHVKIYEQDMLNMLLDGNVKFLDEKWNLFSKTNPFVEDAINEAPFLSIKEYERCRKINKGIIHYANNPKPWQSVNTDKASEWWKYAKLTPFYEEIWAKYCKVQCKHYVEAVDSIKKYRARIKKYKLLSSLTFGKKHKYYYDKYLNNKQCVEFLEKQL